MSEFHVYKNFEAVAQAATDYIHQQIKICIKQHDICHIALPGGSTPARCLELLAETKLDWNKIHWYLGDERCYPVGHEDRNDTMITQQLWSKIASPEKNQHPIPAEQGPEKAAALYSEVIHKIKRLDIAILGMGEDGHTASLFPDNPALELTDAAVPVYNAPKPPTERVSLSIATLHAAKIRIVLATGEGKREIMHRVRAGESLPVNLIKPTHWFLDEAAI